MVGHLSLLCLGQASVLIRPVPEVSLLFLLQLEDRLLPLSQYGQLYSGHLCFCCSKQKAGKKEVLYLLVIECIL